MSRGIMQNDDLLRKAIDENREFAIVCQSEKDAHSKRVSLYNAKRLLSPDDQRKVSISKENIDGNWVVKIKRLSHNIFEIIDGKLVPIKEKLKEDSQQMLNEMLEQGLSREDIIEILSSRGELKETIEEALNERTV
jgi:hypothetical protein